MSTRSKWLDWKPSTAEPPILEKTAPQEPTKPTKPSSVSFVGSSLATFQKIEAEPKALVGEGESDTSRECKAPLAEPTREQIDAAGRILAQAGMRLMELDGVTTVGLWSDLDGLEVRAALAVFHPDGIPPIRYLDSDVPMRFKLRRVPGEPVPGDVLAAMEQEPRQPWVVRDKMLAEMNWTPAGISWAQYQAERLNKLFRTQGVTGQPGKITAAAVEHGERGRK